MADGSSELHEPRELLRKETIDRHRAFVSLLEELEAVDWYDQRVDAADDEQLKAILAHNRDEEKEHAVMALEWLRRRDPVLDRYLREMLFTDGPIVDMDDHGHGDDGGGGEAGGAGGGLEIGSLKGEV